MASENDMMIVVDYKNSLTKNNDLLNMLDEFPQQLIIQATNYDKKLNELKNEQNSDIKSTLRDDLVLLRNEKNKIIKRMKVHFDEIKNLKCLCCDHALLYQCCRPGMAKSELTQYQRVHDFFNTGICHQCTVYYLNTYVMSNTESFDVEAIDQNMFVFKSNSVVCGCVKYVQTFAEWGFEKLIAGPSYELFTLNISGNVESAHRQNPKNMLPGFMSMLKRFQNIFDGSDDTVALHQIIDGLPFWIHEKHTEYVTERVTHAVRFTVRHALPDEQICSETMIRWFANHPIIQRKPCNKLDELLNEKDYDYICPFMRTSIHYPQHQSLIPKDKPELLDSGVCEQCYHLKNFICECVSHIVHPYDGYMRECDIGNHVIYNVKAASWGDTRCIDCWTNNCEDCLGG
jgi:hypothetical protein